jgi:hypothetical protein
MILDKRWLITNRVPYETTSISKTTPIIPWRTHQPATGRSRSIRLGKASLVAIFRGDSRGPRAAQNLIYKPPGRGGIKRLLKARDRLNPSQSNQIQVQAVSTNCAR